MIQIYEMIFPQTVNCWGSQCHLRPGSLGVGWWPSWLFQPNAKANKEDEGTSSRYVNRNPRANHIQWKREVWWSERGAQNLVRSTKSIFQTLHRGEQVQVVPPWPPRSQGQTQARRRHSHEGGDGSKTWWQKNARRLEPRRSLRACATVTGNCFEKKMETHTKGLYQCFKGLQRRQLCEKAAAPCANKCHWAAKLSQE